MPHQTFLSEKTAVWSAPCQLPQALRTPTPLLHPLSKDHGSDGTSFQRMCGSAQMGKQTKWEDVFGLNFLGFFLYNFSSVAFLFFI